MERIRHEANRKRAEAAREQHEVSNPRAGETMVVEHSVPQPERHKSKPAKAAASKTNPGAVARGIPAWRIELELGNKDDLLAKGREKQAQAGEQYGEKHPKEVVSQNDKSSEPHSTRATIAKSAGVSTGQVGMAAR